MDGKNSLTEPEGFESEQCGRCHKETLVINVGCFGSDPYISNTLCTTCLRQLGEELAAWWNERLQRTLSVDKVNAEPPRKGVWRTMEREA